MNMKKLLKKVLPPPVNSFNREINRLHEKLDEIDTHIKIALDNNDVLKNQADIMPYSSLSVEGITYFYIPSDQTIPQCMIQTGVNWAKEDIDNFVKAADHHGYHDQPPENGLFLDIGGNIGTTSIYCKLKLKRAFRFIAFEPLEECARLFEANCAINGVSSDISLVRFGLSNQERKNAMMSVVASNLGGSGIRDEEEIQAAQTLGTPLVSIATTTLDCFLEEQKICADDIKYVWLDVEGHEVEAMEGARRLYKTHKIPTCVEFNQGHYKVHNTYDRMIKLLEEYFDFFLTCEQLAQGNYQLRPINGLTDLWEEFEHRSCDLVLI